MEEFGKRIPHFLPGRKKKKKGKRLKSRMPRHKWDPKYLALPQTNRYRRGAGAPQLLFLSGVWRGVIVLLSNLNPLGTSFKRNKYCWRCGFQKKLHNQGSFPFGKLCANNCGREECSKCGQRLELHTGGNVGPYCVNTPTVNGYYSDWYKQAPTSEPQRTTAII